MPGQGKYKGNQADHQQRQQQFSHAVIPREGEGDANGQRIDAGCNGQHELRPQPGRVQVLVFFRQKRVPDHLCADKRQQAEGNPVVVRLQRGLEIMQGEPAQKGHQPLKQAEQRRHPKDMPLPSFLTDDTAYDRDREAVHRQRDRNQDDFPKTHHSGRKVSNSFRINEQSRRPILLPGPLPPGRCSRPSGAGRKAIPP